MCYFINFHAIKFTNNNFTSSIAIITDAGIGNNLVPVDLHTFIRAWYLKFDSRIYSHRQDLSLPP